MKKLSLFVCLGLSAFSMDVFLKTELAKLIDTDYIKEYVKQDIAEFGHKVKSIESNPSHVTAFSVQYHLRSPLLLNPNEARYFAIPKNLHNYPIAGIMLGHQQKIGEQTGDSDNSYANPDECPGFTSLQVRSQEDDEWRYWGGPASGKLGSKYAEIRGSSLEYDNLWGWPIKGHRSVKTSRGSKKLITADVLKVVSVGCDKVRVGHITFKTITPEPSFYQEVSFTKDTTSLGDLRTTNGAKFGGGQKYRGTFPEALRLGRSGDRSHDKLPDGWSAQGDKIIIPIDRDRKFMKVDFAIGDSREDEVRNSDGGWGSKGGAKVKVDYISAEGVSENLIYRENIGPEGITTAYPLKVRNEAKVGSKIVITVVRDYAFIMGIRLSYQ